MRRDHRDRRTLLSTGWAWAWLAVDLIVFWALALAMHTP